MLENIINFIKSLIKKDEGSKDAAKERLQLVLMQDRANVSADYLDLMKQEIIDVIKKYVNIDENALEVELTKIKNKDVECAVTVNHNFYMLTASLHKELLCFFNKRIAISREELDCIFG